MEKRCLFEKNLAIQKISRACDMAGSAFVGDSTFEG
jgi:hypothetical protein